MVGHRGMSVGAGTEVLAMSEGKPPRHGRHRAVTEVGTGCEPVKRAAVALWDPCSPGGWWGLAEH